MGALGPGQTSDSESIELDYDFQCYFMYTQRMDLYRRIDQRCEEMLTGSLLTEFK